MNKFEELKKIMCVELKKSMMTMTQPIRRDKICKKTNRNSGVETYN